MRALLDDTWGGGRGCGYEGQLRTSQITDSKNEK